MMRLGFLLLATFGLLCLCQQNILPWRGSWDRPEFISLNGKRADPCHIRLNLMNTDCPYNKMPDSSNTILAPVVTSNGQPATFYTDPAMRTLIFQGHYFLGIDDLQPITAIGLSSMGGRCSSIDASRTFAAATSADKTVTFQVPLEWLSVRLELEERPRAICFSRAGAGAGNLHSWIYTGFHWKVVWNCNGGNLGNGNQACPPPVYPVTPVGLPDKIGAAGVGAAGSNFYNEWPMNDTYILRRNAQTTCCLNSVGTGNWQISQCINPRIHECCGSSALEKFEAKCCRAQAYETSQWNEGACPCYRDTTLGPHCPVGETCCLPTKYPELNVDTNRDLHGECYNTSSVYQCCDTGKRFDSGSQQCCTINGVQSLDIPCPCGKDTDCIGNMADLNDNKFFSCCRQQTPTLWEAANEKIKTNPAIACNKYANYPNGTGLYNVQPCLGTCIDSRYQICCNGASCVGKLEYCCNSTCCNRFVGTCATGRRPGAPGAWSNPDGFGELFLQCSTIEQMNIIKAFWVFVLPTELMLATFLGLAICLGFAARQSDVHKFSPIERIMIGIGFLTILFAITLFFAPVYKYGLLTVIAALVAIVTASARIRWLNIGCIVLHLILIFYLFDFVHGNSFIQLSSNRIKTAVGLGNIDVDSMGVLHATRQMFPSITRVQDEQACVKYYNYFSWDRQIRDYERFDNPEVTTFGYCSRAWVVALYLFENAIMDLALLQLTLSLLLLLNRFKSSYDPVVLTVMEGKDY